MRKSVVLNRPRSSWTSSETYMLPARNDGEELARAHLCWYTWTLSVKDRVLFSSERWPSNTGKAAREQAPIHPAPTHTNQCALRTHPVTKRSLSPV